MEILFVTLLSAVSALSQDGEAYFRSILEREVVQPCAIVFECSATGNLSLIQNEVQRAEAPCVTKIVFLSTDNSCMSLELMDDAGATIRRIVMNDQWIDTGEGTIWSADIYRKSRPFLDVSRVEKDKFKDLIWPLTFVHTCIYPLSQGSLELKDSLGYLNVSYFEHDDKKEVFELTLRSGWSAPGTCVSRLRSVIELSRVSGKVQRRAEYMSETLRTECLFYDDSFCFRGYGMENGEIDPFVFQMRITEHLDKADQNGDCDIIPLSSSTVRLAHETQGQPKPWSWQLLRLAEHLVPYDAGIFYQAPLLLLAVLLPLLLYKLRRGKRGNEDKHV